MRPWIHAAPALQAGSFTSQGSVCWDGGGVRPAQVDTRSQQASRGPRRGRDQHTPRCSRSQGTGAGGSPCEGRTRKDVQVNKAKSVLGSLRGEMEKVGAQIAGLQVSEEPERPPGRGLLSGGLELGRRHSRGRTQGFQTSAGKRGCVGACLCVDLGPERMSASLNVPQSPGKWEGWKARFPWCWIWKAQIWCRGHRGHLRP